MLKMGALRLAVLIGCAVLLMVPSSVALVQIVGWVRLYLVAATNQFYTPVQESNSYHFFGSALRFLRPALPYLLMFVAVQVGAAYALSRSGLFKTRPFVFGLSLTLVTSAVVTAVLWMRVAR